MADIIIDALKIFGTSLSVVIMGILTIRNDNKNRKETKEQIEKANKETKEY